MPHARSALLPAILLMLLLVACQPVATSSRSPVVAPMSRTEMPSPLAGARQLVLVVSKNFDSNQARMRRFARSGNGRWQPVGDAVAVTIGRNGMAWGRGLHGTVLGPGPVKVEGDGRTPAGVYSFAMAFAYDPHEMWKPTRMPIHRVTEQTVCVETINSASYNRIVDEDEVSSKDWGDPDRMLRPDGLYRFGLLVNHNAPDTKPGAGSCIFFHLWRRPGATTAGCTAMNTSSMLALLAWIDETKHPVTVELPQAELERLAPAWGAPELLARGDEE